MHCQNHPIRLAECLHLSPWNTDVCLLVVVILPLKTWVVFSGNGN
jgi:hypothetical protein